MKNPILKCIAFVVVTLTTHAASAQEPAARVLNLINPTQSIGIQIGDLLERKVVLEVSDPYQISKNSLPVKNVGKNGVELENIDIKADKKGNKTIYTISLHYQVFANANSPVVMRLPQESFALTGGAQASVINIPVWRFWFSPLVTATITTAKDSLQPQYKTTLIDTDRHQYLLAGYIGLLLIGLAGLVYINAERRWLPFMNGAFAQAHRSIRKLPRDQSQEKKALSYMHEAFNKVFGANLFPQDIARFLEAHPEFDDFEAEIKAFFDRSNRALFAGKESHGDALIKDLILLSKRLRDCERGVA